MPVTRSTQKKESFYAVAKGKKIGIFSTWDEAQPLVNRFHGAKYKKFNSLAEARSFLGKGYENETVTYLQLDDSLEHLSTKDSHDAPSTSSGATVKSSTASASPTKNITNVAASSTSPITGKVKDAEAFSLAILPHSVSGESLQFFQDNSLLLCMTQSNLYQVHSFAPKNVHSWFTSNYINAGQCRYFTKVDPILVCLRHFYTHTLDQGFKTLDHILTGVPHLNCQLIRSLDFGVICDTTKSSVESTCHQGSSGDEKAEVKYQINLDCTLTYLQNKVNSVVSIFAATGKGEVTRVKDESSTPVSLALEQLHLFLPEPLYEQLVKRCS